jgi:hypothetical protein
MFLVSSKNVAKENSLSKFDSVAAWSRPQNTSSQVSALSICLVDDNSDHANASDIVTCFVIVPNAQASNLLVFGPLKLDAVIRALGKGDEPHVPVVGDVVDPVEQVGRLSRIVGSTECG